MFELNKKVKSKQKELRYHYCGSISLGLLMNRVKSKLDRIQIQLANHESS